LREQLKSVRESGALFNTDRFARNLEQRLQELVAAL
jgi:predicted O-linked N-acetylglucosamine transferase (SPINDLY family)